jgi:hypothetical protein
VSRPDLYRHNDLRRIHHAFLSSHHEGGRPAPSLLSIHEPTHGGSHLHRHYHRNTIAAYNSFLGHFQPRPSNHCTRSVDLIWFSTNLGILGRATKNHILRARTIDNASGRGAWGNSDHFGDVTHLSGLHVAHRGPVCSLREVHPTTKTSHDTKLHATAKVGHWS